MKEIKLTQNKTALVDDADHIKLCQFKWYAAYISGKWYAARNIKVDGRYRMLLMHQAILPADGVIRDHKDGNGLNNQRDNLRICTYSENAQNSKSKSVFKTSPFKGVSWSRQKMKWRSEITVLGRRIFLGLHPLEIDAAKAYDAAARIYFGEFARTNFMEV